MECRELSINGFIDEVAKASCGSHPRKFCFVLGSGASKTSGIKSGQELVERWDRELLERNEAEYHRWKSACGITDENMYSFYSQYYEKRFEKAPIDGKSLLEGLMASAKPSAGYAMLAYILAKLSYSLNVVVTTNFDHLIEDAIHDYVHKIPLVVGHVALAHYVMRPFNRPTIVKIHHDLLFDPKNTPNEVSTLDDAWTPALNTIFEEYHPIFIGYAGNDPSLMDYLRRSSQKFSSGAWKFPYWLLYKSDVLSKDAEQFISEADGYLIRHSGFDETLLRLGSALGCKLPSEKEFISEAKERFKNLSRSIDEFSERMSPRTSEPTHSKTAPKPASDASPELSQAIDRITEQTESQRMYKDAIMFDIDGKYEQALEIEAQLVKRDPNNSLYHYRYGTTLGNVERFDDAIKELTEAIKLEPNSASYYCELGTAFAGANQPDAAIKNFLKAIELEPDEAYFHYWLGDVLIDIEKYSEAVSHFERAIELNPDDGYCHARLSYALYSMDRHEEALSEIKIAISAEPEDAYLHFEHGQILLDMERFDDAIEAFQKAVDIAPEDATYHLELGQSLWLNGDFEGACKEIQQAIDITPDCALYHHELGHILHEESEYSFDLALTPDELDVESVSVLKAANVAIKSTLGKVDDYEGEDMDEPPFDQELMAQAILELRKAAELAPENAIYQYDLGDALWDAGELNAAANQMKRALVLDPDNDQYQTTLKRIETEIAHRSKGDSPS